MIQTVSMRAPLLVLCALLVSWCLAPAAAAQKLRDREKPVNDPVQCPYCFGDETLMRASGITSHGGFEFSKGTTVDADKRLAGLTNILWAQTAHFAIGSGLPPVKVDGDERDKIREECGRLRAILPEVPEKPRMLDPWLRLHLIAMRLEDFYKEYQQFLGVTDANFPAAPGYVWDMQGEFRGLGPFLGMNRRYEVMLMPSEGAASTWLRSEFGLTTKKPQRWHIIESGTLQYTTHLDDGGLKNDIALHGNLIFNLTQMLSHGYKHYSYDLPVWLLEGMAHWFERRISPKYNSFDSGEGAAAEMTSKDNWEPPTRKLVTSGEAEGLAVLLRMRGHAELNLDRHYITWSMVDYLQREHPGFLSKLLRRISGLTNSEGITDGTLLPEAHRAAFKDELGMGYPEFDRAWAAWVLENYSSK